MSGRDWQAWHEPYDDPASPLARRLRCVQRHVAAWLDGADHPGARAVSLCAGQGRDLVEVLAERGRDLPARLVELDPGLVDRARALAAGHGLSAVEVVRADAGRTDTYAGAVPADLVLACGVFGNVPDDDVRRTVQHLPMLCAPGATVIWTRSRRDPDLTPAIRSWLTAAGFAEVAFDAPADALWSVGVHRLVGEPVPLAVGERMFSFAPAGPG